MKTRADMLAWRRQLLIAESNAQRADLALQVQPLMVTLSSVNLGMRIVERIRKHPGWIAVLTFGLITIRPHRLSAFLRLGTSILRVWRHAMPLLHSVTKI